MSTTEKSILGEIIVDWMGFVRVLLWEKPWRMFLLIFALLAGYGGKLVTFAYNNDNIYFLIKSHPLALMNHHRYGNTLCAILGLFDREIFFWSTWLKLGFLVVTGLLFAYYFYQISGKRLQYGALFVFLLCFTLYPLHMESLVYPGISLGFSLVALSLLLIQRSNYKSGWVKHLLPVFLLMLAFSSYEVYVLVYSVAVLAALFLQACLEENVHRKKVWTTLWHHGLYILGALFLWGVLIWIMKALHCYETGSGPAREILWLTNWETIRIALAKLICYFGINYIFSSLFYFSILEVWIAVTVADYFIFRKRGLFCILSGLLILMLIAMFTLSVLQCKIQPYRTCQSFAIFVGFFMMLFYQWHGSGSKVVKIAIFFIILLQTKELALMTKFEREASEHASYCFKTLGHEIKKQFPDYVERKVFIVGACREWRKIEGKDTLQLPFFYKYQSLGYYQEIGKNHFYIDYHEQAPMLLEYHTGIKVENLSEEERKLWGKQIQATRQPAWPVDGYIREVDGNILVNMGNEDSFKRDSSILTPLRVFMRKVLGMED